MLWLSGVLLFPPAQFPWYTLNACHNYMYSKQTAVAAHLGPANTKTFLNFSKVGISVVSAARGKYWHKWIWTLQSFLYSGLIVPWKQMKSIEKSENMTGCEKTKMNERCHWQESESWQKWWYMLPSIFMVSDLLQLWSCVSLLTFISKLQFYKKVGFLYKV